MQLLTLDELAVRLRTTPMALYCRRSRDPYALPPVVKIPRDKRMYFSAEVLDDWIADPTSFMPAELRPRRKSGRPAKCTKGPARKRPAP